MGSLRVGVGVSDITPSDQWIEEGKIWLWGFGGRDAACNGIYQRISARALVIQDADGTSFVLAAVDIGALDPAMTARIRNRVCVSPRNISSEQICINVSHTHGAPVPVAIPTWQPGVDVPDVDYASFLEDQIVDAIEAAFAAVQPATVSFGRGTTQIGFDRHFNPQAHYDPTLDVVKVTTTEGDVIAVAFFAACHPVCLGAYDQVYSDFPGVARDQIEATVGGVALFFQGYGGICNPGGDVTACGTALARDVKTVLNSTLVELDGSIGARLSSIDLPFQPLPSAAKIDQARNSEGIYARWANHMQSGAIIPAALPTPLQGLRLGLPPHDWYLVASGHEVSTDFGPVVRGIWPYPRVTTLGYCNSQLSYVPSDKVLQNPPTPDFPFGSNYEGGHSFLWYGHRAPLALGVDQRFYDGHVALLDPGWQQIGHATTVTAMAAWDGTLFATTANGKLWYREPVAHDIPWTHLGHAETVVGLAALNGKLFCATSAGTLWCRDTNGVDLPWQAIGHAEQITAMTVFNGKLFATTSLGGLWQRDPVASDIPWESLGHALGVVGLAVAWDKLIAATSDGNLHWRAPQGVDLPWHRFARAEHVVGMAAIDNVLFVATQEGVLWRRNP